MELIKHIFSNGYMFDPAFGPLSLSDKIYFAIALVAAVYGVFLIFYKRTLKNPIKKEFFSRWQSMALTIGVLGLIWTFLRYERIQTLGTHFVILVIYLIGVIWKFNLIRYWLNEYKPKKELWDKEQEKKRYM